MGLCSPAASSHPFKNKLRIKIQEILRNLPSAQRGSQWLAITCAMEQLFACEITALHEPHSSNNTSRSCWVFFLPPFCGRSLGLKKVGGLKVYSHGESAAGNNLALKIAIPVKNTSIARPVFPELFLCCWVFCLFPRAPVCDLQYLEMKR